MRDEAIEVTGVTVQRESEKAVLAAAGGVEAWVPRSQMRSETDLAAGRLVIPRWLAEAKGFLRRAGEAPVPAETTPAPANLAAPPLAAPPAASWKRRSWVVVDVETTGFDASRDRVIEIGFCHVEDGRVAERRGWLLDPGLEALPPKITEITGLRIEDLRGRPAFADTARDVLAHLARGEATAAYNAPFDRAFVEAELRRCGHAGALSTWLDPLVWVREFDKYERGKKLTEAAARRGIAISGSHRAEADAEMAARVLLSMMDRLPDALDELLAAQEKLRASQDAELKAWRGRSAR